MATTHLLRRSVLIGAALIGTEFVRELRPTRRLQSEPPATPPRDWEPFGNDGRLVKLIFIGDSLISGRGVAKYSDAVARRTARGLAAAGYQGQMKNLAHDGAHVKDIEMYAVIAANEHPTLAVVCVGGNDVRHTWRVPAFETHLRKVVGHLQRRGPAPEIALMGVPDLTVTPVLGHRPLLRNGAGPLGRRLNRVTVAVAKDTGAHFVPLSERLADRFRGHSELFAKDGFHLNGKGCSLVAEELVKSLEEVLSDRPVLRAA